MSDPFSSRRVLVVSDRSGPGETRAGLGLGALAQTEGVLLAPGDSLPDPVGRDAVVIDAALLADAPDAGVLRTWVEQGGSLLVRAGGGERLPRPFGPAVAELTGLSGTGPALPAGEWFTRVVAPRHPVVRRARAEFAVFGTLVPLEAEAGAHTLLTVSVGFRDLCVLAERRVGAGRVVTAGLCETGSVVPLLASLTHLRGASGLRRLARTGEESELDRILTRALSPVAAERHREAPVGVAIVGYGPYGGMGHAHGLAVQATDGLELMAVCDPSPERRKEAERQFAGVRAYGELDELLVDDDVGIAIVATPPSSHFDLGLALLHGSRHVVMEKPLCFTLAEADTLEAAAAAAGVSLTVHQNRRWDTDFLAVRSAVEAGALGDVFNVETFVGGFDHPCRAWHSEVSVSGGAAYDWGAHHLDWILLLLDGSPVRVTSTGHKRVWNDVTNFDQERIHLWWADGREAEFVHSDVAAVRRPKFYVQGTAGTLVGTYRPLTFERIEAGRGFVAENAHHAEAPAELRLVSYVGDGALADTAVPLAPERRFVFHRNLADHVHDGQPLAVTVASVRPVVAVLEAARRSAEGGGVSEPVPE